MRDFPAVLDQANKDFEFTREIRYYTGRLHVSIGDQAWEAAYEDGKFVSVAEAGTVTDAALSISGSVEQWEAMTAEHPPPFFQSLQSSSIKHGVRLSNTDQLFAYLPALNRLMQIFRQANVEGA
jgi:adenosine deaminase